MLCMKLRVFSFSLLILTAQMPCEALSGGDSTETTDLPPSATDHFHPFESLSLATKVVIFVAGLILATSVAIAATAYMISVCRKCCRHADDVHSVGGSLRSSNSFRLYTSLHRSQEDHGLGVQNHQFGQQTSLDEGNSPVMASDASPYGALVCSNPGKRGGRKGGDSLRSVPEEDMLGNNRVAPTTKYSYTLNIDSRQTSV